MDRTNGRSRSNQKPLHRGSRTCRPFAPNQTPFKEDRGFVDWLGGWRCVGESVAIGANGNGEMKATGGDAEWAWALVLEYSSA